MKTLRDLRIESGLSIAQILEGVRQIAPEVAPKKRSGIINWEVQGIQNAEVLNALAHVYKRPFSEVLQAAKHSKALFQKPSEKLLKSAITA